MGNPVYVYAIYPFNENGDYAGVYVGATEKLKERLRVHRNNKQAQDKQSELHSLMREHGYTYQILEIITDYKDAHLEYDWIDFFEKQTSLKVFNTRKVYTPDYKNCTSRFSGAVGRPVFVKGGVVWSLD